MMEGMESVLAIFFIFGSPVVIVLIVFGFRLLRYSQRQRTIRLALEKGLDISSLHADETSEPPQPRKYVLRGLLWALPGLLIGAGVTWAGIRHDIPTYFAMFGWVPAAIGAAYLIFYRSGLAQNSSDGGASLPATSIVPPRRTIE